MNALPQPLEAFSRTLSGPATIFGQSLLADHRTARHRSGLVAVTLAIVLLLAIVVTGKSIVASLIRQTQRDHEFGRIARLDRAIDAAQRAHAIEPLAGDEIVTLPVGNDRVVEVRRDDGGGVWIATERAGAVDVGSSLTRKLETP